MSDNSDNLLLLGIGAIGAGILALMGKKNAEKNETSFGKGLANVVEDGLNKIAGEAEEVKRNNIRKLSNEQLLALYNKNDLEREIRELTEAELERRHVTF